MHGAADGRPESIEQHLFDTDVIMKVFNVTQGRRRARQLHVNGRAAVCGEGKWVCLSERSDLHKAGHPAATRSVRLQNIHCLRCEHALQVKGAPAVLAGSNIHARRSLGAQQVQAGQIVGADRLFKPGNLFFFGKPLSKRERLLLRVGSFASTKSSASGPIALRAVCTRQSPVRGVRRSSSLPGVCLVAPNRRADFLIVYLCRW